jgi:hypothetical protein
LATAATLCGALAWSSAGALGLTLLLTAGTGEYPALLCAATVKVYVMPLTKPEKYTEVHRPQGAMTV